MIIDENKKMLETKPAAARKPYTRPVLIELGDLRTLTLGPSPAGYFDSSGGLYSETFPPLPTP